MKIKRTMQVEWLNIAMQERGAGRCKAMHEEGMPLYEPDMQGTQLGKAHRKYLRETNKDSQYTIQ